VSLLKRVLVDDLGSLFRRRSAVDSERRIARPQGRDAGGDVPDRAKPSPGSATGMTAVILNWKLGENDPFTVVNATIRQHFRACGKNVEVIEISEDNWVARLADLVPAGVEFAFTWQGLGSDDWRGERGECVWDLLKIPLMCVHGDHPSHRPVNHALESHYCFHLYTNAEFARYSNRHFRRVQSASVIDIPQLHREPRLERRAGDHFVVAKNVDDPVDTERRWREQFDKPVFDAYMTAVETLRHRLAQEPYVEIHEVLDDLIAERGFDWMRPSADLVAHHQYHRELDVYVHSHKSIAAVECLREFPVRVYGRGWDRIARGAPAHHTFAPGRTMADSQGLFYSRFGLIDISPAKGLHDRTRRAMVNGTGFLSSANLEDSLTDIGRFDSLFFDFRRHVLPEKCAAVVRDPDGHAAVAQQFADRYHDTFHFRHFVNRFDYLAKLARAH
jgi:hypothetical protein